MDIAIIGSGYVGLVSGACFADFGHAVTCVDTCESRIANLRAGAVPFYEPGLTELVARNAAVGRLKFTTDLGDALRDATVIFLAVGTPQGEDGQADLSQIEAAAREICSRLDGRYRVLVTKSTVPAGTGTRLQRMILDHAPNSDVDVVSNPEFLREGSAINDFMRPDRVVIGTASERAAALMREIYRPLYLIETPFLITDVITAEMIKVAANAFLATKISFINEIANLCDRAGADVHNVAKGLGLDKRIGSKFLHPGPGYGGSCFPKDTRALAALGVSLGARQHIVEAAIAANERQKASTFEKIQAHFGTVAGRTIAILGLTFKPNTSDVRESPTLDLCRALLGADAVVRAADPVGVEEARTALGKEADRIEFGTDAYAIAADVDALVIMTEWNEYRSLDLRLVRQLMRGALLVDARNVLDPYAAVQAGFNYMSTGRQAVAAAGAAV